MSAHTAGSFKLPSLSYIDAKWEEPNLRAPAAAPVRARQSGLAAWLASRIEAYRKWRRDSEAAAELAAMSNYELMDIGLTRSDIDRVFDPVFNQDLQARGRNR
jgi:uncharacterized protein YjiS (DUF1127 family)